MLITEDEYLTKKSKDLISLKCVLCSETFFRTKHEVNWARIRSSKDGVHRMTFCGRKCSDESLITKLDLECGLCKKPLKRQLACFQKSKTKRFFCNKSCATIYNNAHKTTGTRRSKLEVYVENKLVQLFPNLEIHFNRKDAINGELDIYIPSLKLAFELNGIFHYEPIFTKEKLEGVQNNDRRKFQAYIEHKIELCIIDTSKQGYFKEKSSETYLSIISNLIKHKSGGN